MSRALFSARAGRLSLWLGGAALAFLAFVRITRELIEGDVSAVDRVILLAVARTRAPWLTVAAIDVTALGSITVVVLFSAFTRGVACVARPTRGRSVARGFGGSRNTDDGDQKRYREISSRGSRAADCSVGLLIPERTLALDFRTLPDDRDHRRSSCTTLRRKGRDLSCRGRCAPDGWCFPRVPWRSLCDRRC
jgi:hypothetical protein